MRRETEYTDAGYVSKVSKQQIINCRNSMDRNGSRCSQFAHFYNKIQEYRHLIELNKEHNSEESLEIS